MKNLFVFAIIVLIFSCKKNKSVSTFNQEKPQQKQHVIKDIQTILDSANVAGSILIYDLKQYFFYSNDFKWSKKGRLPASTFKIPNSIINNPGDLSEEDFMTIKKHPDYGYEMLGDKELHTDEGVDIKVVSRVVHEHHENFNGTGYPTGLKEEEIHLLARITATADFFDAITTKRSYHEVLSVEDAVEVMRKTVGKKLDPEVFKVFERVVKEGQVGQEKFDMSLPDSFDPCQPQNVLPFRKDRPKGKSLNGKKEKADHGKVTSDSSFGSLKKKKTAS